MLLLAGCSTDTTSIRSAKVLIYGRSESCLIKINENGTVEYISCKVDNTNLRNENIIKEVYKEKTIRLSSKNKTIVNELIEEILSNEPIKEVSVLDAITITALIDDKIYLSTYDYYNNRSFDENLANLIYKLIELSPIKVGGKDNPIRVPNQK